MVLTDVGGTTTAMVVKKVGAASCVHVCASGLGLRGGWSVGVTAQNEEAYRHPCSLLRLAIAETIWQAKEYGSEAEVWMHECMMRTCKSSPTLHPHPLFSLCWTILPPLPSCVQAKEYGEAEVLMNVICCAPYHSAA